MPLRISSLEDVQTTLVLIARRLRPRVRSRAAFRHTQHPLDRFKVHLADVGIRPRFFRVAKGGIENPPFAIHLVPRHGEVMIRPVDARVVRIVESRGIETEQDVDLVARPLLGLIDLVIFNERSGEMTNCGKALVFIDDRRIEREPWVLVKPTADHLAIFRPFVIGVEGSVNAHKAFSVVLDERHHIFLLAAVQVKLPCGAHKDQGIKVIQILRVSSQVLLRDELGVGAERGIPETAVATRVVDGSHSIRNGIVLKSLGLTDHQDVLEMDLLRNRRGRDRRIQSRLILGAREAR
jgi:hypothetical protein